MADVKTRMVIDGESAKATQAAKATEDAIRRLGPAAEASTAQAERAAGRFGRAWQAMNQQVQVDGITRGNFSAEMIGSALMSLTGDASKLAGEMSGLNTEQTKYTESLMQMGVGIASGNPFIALAAGAKALVGNLLEVFRATKQVDEAAKRVGVDQTGESRWDRWFAGKTHIGASSKADVEAYRARQAKDPETQRRQAEAKAAAEKEAAATRALTIEKERLTLSSTDFAIAQAKRELDEFVGTAEQRKLALTITEERIKAAKDAEMKAAEDRDAKRNAETKAMQIELQRMTMSETEFAIAQAKRELDEFVGTAEQRVVAEKIAQAKIYQAQEKARQAAKLRLQQRLDDEIRAKQAAQNKELSIVRAHQAKLQARITETAKKEADARKRTLMNPADLAKQEQQSKQAARARARDDAKVNRIVDQARRNEQLDRPLSRRQRAALDFDHQRKARKADEDAVKEQAKNISKIEKHLETLSKDTAALYGTASQEGGQ